VTTAGYTSGFADVEYLVTRLLRDALAVGGPPGVTVRVVTDLPPHVETVLPVVRVAAAGGSDDRLCSHDRVDVETFAATRGDARDLAERVRTAMRAASHSLVDGWLIDLVTTEAGPVWIDYQNDQVRRYITTYMVESRIRSAR
jgi:hypothetical protein